MKTTNTNITQKATKGNNIKVYYATIPQDIHNCETLQCTERLKEIDDCSNAEVKMQKYYVWKLLEFAVAQFCDASKVHYRKEDFGKWKADGIEFSLCHTGNLVAVALSTAPIGIDAEKVTDRFNERLAKRIANDNDCKTEKTPEGIAALWTAKESIFKLQNEKSYVAKNIAVTPNAVKHYYLPNEMMLCVAFCEEKKVDFFEVEFDEQTRCKSKTPQRLYPFT